MDIEEKLLTKLKRLEAEVDELKRREVADPLHRAFSNAFSAYLSLHVLRGFWAMTYDENLDIIDYSGQGRNLTRVRVTVNQTTNISPLVPYATFAGGTGTERYLYRNDEAGFDLTGAAELIGVTAQRGITLGTWVRVGELPGTVNKGIIGKYETSGDQRSYMLYTTGTDLFRMGVSSAGTSMDNTVTAGSAFEVSRWYFLVGRWIPSTSVSLWVNDVKVENTSSVTSSVYSSTARLEIGSYAGGSTTTTWSHNQQFPFLCAAALSDDVINALFHNTRALFGV